MDYDDLKINVVVVVFAVAAVAVDITRCSICNNIKIVTNIFRISVRLTTGFVI